MGGIGYITAHRADVARNNSLINLHMLEAAKRAGVKRFLFTSSACVYPAQAQASTASDPLAESDAIPAEPERGYGWEKIYAEQLCDYYREDHSLDVRVVRFHNVYGPLGTYEGGREKAPAALCRKIAAMTGGTIDVWGDGQQTRSFLYVDDCIEGIRRIMESGYTQPINLGSEEMVSIDQLAFAVAAVAGKNVALRHTDAPQGVRGRNSNNALLRDVTGWEPTTRLTDGLARTYPWIAEQVAKVAAC
jgi:nucleoside-diphosphate-sugar epimerase